MPPTFPFLPPRIAGLADLACNLSWSWNRDARALFRALDEHLWVRFRYDPLAMLAAMRPESIALRATDREFLAQYDHVMRWFAGEGSPDATWFASTYPTHRSQTVAYFCAEFGLYHSVPIYSGGLGILAGDHCKTASDLGVPMVGVGILYRGGYFDQRIRIDGWQEETNNQLDPSQTPLEVLSGPNGEPYLATVRTGGREVRVRAWRLRVGRVPIYLLDTDLEDNHPGDRALLSKLYAGGPEWRLRQEWLLGVGGVRVLRALGIAPAMWHAERRARDVHAHRASAGAGRGRLDVRRSGGPGPFAQRVYDSHSGSGRSRRLSHGTPRRMCGSRLGRDGDRPGAVHADRPPSQR